MRTQTFGVEIEMTGLTRKKASEVAAKFFGTASEYVSSSYDKYGTKDNTGRLWFFASDCSVHVESKNGGQAQSVELVTPILRYEDIETLQELIRRLRKAGDKVLFLSLAVSREAFLFQLVGRGYVFEKSC